MKDAVDILNDQLTAAQRLNVEIGRLRQRESMLEAQIEVLELTIGKLRCVCDAAFASADRIADLERTIRALRQEIADLVPAPEPVEQLTEASS